MVLVLLRSIVSFFVVLTQVYTRPGESLQFVYYSALICVRLIAGPLVVGIREALWRRYYTREEAEEAYEAAKDDGIAVTLRLAHSMPPRFLNLS